MEVDSFAAAVAAAPVRFENAKLPPSFVAPEGIVTLYRDGDDPTTLCIYSIVVRAERRRQGVFARLLETMAADASVARIAVLTVESLHLDRYLQRLRLVGAPFACHGSDWVWTRPSK